MSIPTNSDEKVKGFSLMYVMGLDPLQTASSTRPPKAIEAPTVTETKAEAIVVKKKATIVTPMQAAVIIIIIAAFWLVRARVR